MLAILQTRNRFAMATLFLFIVAAAAASTAFAGEEPRQSISTEYAGADREAGAPRRISRDGYSAMKAQGSRSAAKQSSADFWIYSADVVLFNDHDQDGYYHGIDLLFDADTNFISADVYAVVYLSLEGGPWNEYASTDYFTLFSTSADDEYNIVTELVSGYPTGSYDLLIEIFDAVDDSFVASFGPVDTSELAFLPLEDRNRDVVQPPTTVIVRDGGGSFGWTSLFVLLALLVVSRVVSIRSPGS